MTHQEDNDILWASGRLPYAIAIKRELQELGYGEVIAIQLINKYSGYVSSCMERGRKPSLVATEIKTWDEVASDIKN
jgi:hypothetical protein